jgi:trk system potassium uptake protein
VADSIGRHRGEKAGIPFALGPVVHIVGWFVTVLGILMLVPGLVDWVAGHPDWQVFAVAACVSTFTGAALIFSYQGHGVSLSRRQGFVLTTAVWIAASIAGSLPLAFSKMGVSYTDAFFEAMSGPTTTGSTVFVGLDEAPPGILLWRGILQWVGGIGFIVVGLAMLPFLRVGGMQLFRLESSEKADKTVPQAKKFAALLLLVYVSLTVACMLLLDFAGMSHFEAVVHSMTTISTGGFSTSDTSIGHFDNVAIDWILIAFMILSSVPFLLYVQALHGRPMLLFRDGQVRTFLRLLIVACVGITYWLWSVDGYAAFDALTSATFNIVSIVTTTGFVSSDYAQWGSLPVGLFFLLTFVGGCTGSTAGGIKIFRIHMFGAALRVHIQRLIFPHGVFTTLYNTRRVPDDVTTGVFCFLGAYLLTWACVSMILEAMGVDLLTSVTAAATAVGNVGPGLGRVIGPTGTFASLPDAAKWILALAMLLGRLELFTVLALLAPQFWHE